MSERLTDDELAEIDRRANIPLHQHGYLDTVLASSIRALVAEVRASRRARLTVSRGSDDRAFAVREELARIVEMIARDGLPGPRDLDVALDAILAVVAPPVRACHGCGSTEIGPTESACLKCSLVAGREERR